MGRLFGGLASLFVYLCVGTILTQLIIVGYAVSQGFVDKQKLSDMLAVARGATLSSADDASKATQAKPVQMMSIEELDQRRTTMTRHLELREQAVANALEQIATERDKLLKDREAFDLLVAAFRKQQQQEQSRELAEGMEKTRALLESLKPDAAKNYILKMIADDDKDDVIAILTAMPIAKQKKIVEQFKTEEEQRKFYDILKLLQEVGGNAPAETATAAAPPPTGQAPLPGDVQQP
jgi:hypothetical protein